MEGRSTPQSYGVGESERAPRLLLVEDSESDAELLRIAFDEVLPGAVLEVAEDGERALAALAAGPPPDLVLLDLNLPRISGHEVLAELRAHADPAVARLPVVVLTTSRAPGDVRRAYAAGASAFVPKPFDLDELLRTVRALAGFWLETALLPGGG